jgi:hypothetical protein
MVRMKISDRFTDYGLFGGFFWLLQLAIWCVLEAWTPMDLIHFIDANFKTLPMSVTSLLGGLGLILVFVTGMVLDLLGSQLFKLVELGVFIDLVLQHFDWLVPFLKESRTYIGSDFDATHKKVRLTTAFTFNLGGGRM